jgi:hypothetical protein
MPILDHEVLAGEPQDQRLGGAATLGVSAPGDNPDAIFKLWFRDW